MPNETKMWIIVDEQKRNAPFTYISIKGPAAIATDRRKADRLVGALGTGASLDCLDVHTTGRTTPLRTLLIIAL